MAGWVTLVCLRSSAVPSNIISVIENPKIEFALLKYSCANGDFSKRSKPIPENCAPWPGKIYACMLLLFLWITKVGELK